MQIEINQIHDTLCTKQKNPEEYAPNITESSSERG